MGFWQNIFYNKSIKRLRLMLESVRMRDFSLQYSLDKLTGEERRMAEEINAVINEFRETERKHQGETHLYDALLSNVDSILIATDDTGKTKWMNRAAIVVRLPVRQTRQPVGVASLVARTAERATQEQHEPCLFSH